MLTNIDPTKVSRELSQPKKKTFSDDQSSHLRNKKVALAASKSTRKNLKDVLESIGDDDYVMDYLPYIK